MDSISLNKKDSTLELRCQLVATPGLLNKASSLGSGVGTLRRGEESATKPSDLIRQGEPLPAESLGLVEAPNSYKDCIALTFLGTSHTQNEKKQNEERARVGVSRFHDETLKVYNSSVVECDGFYDTEWPKVLASASRRKYDAKRALLAYASTHPGTPLTDELKTKALAERAGTKECPGSWLHGTDKAGHSFAKELYCGAEWCKVCGKKDSVVHKRRFESWLPKAQQTSHLGLFVIEFPLASRNKPRKRKALEYYGKLVVKVLTGRWEIDGRRARGEILRRGEVAEIKAKYFERGMRRWHYFGDVKKELGKLGFDELFSSDVEMDVLAPQVKSNVHLNVLVDAGYLQEPWLRHLVSTLRIAFGEPNLIVNYGYVAKPGQMVHLLKYTTRATFLDYRWDEWLAGQLYGFRNMRSWGVWCDDEVWSLPDAEIGEDEASNMLKRRSLGESRCYKDGLKITWSKPRPIGELRSIVDAVPLGAGYYELPGAVPPGHEAEGPVMRWRRLVVKAMSLALADRLELERVASVGDMALSMFPHLVGDIRYTPDISKNLPGSHEDVLLCGEVRNYGSG